MMRMNIPAASLLILSSLLLAAVFGDDNNVLLTGDVLATNNELSYGGATFVMQGDCNLVLYNSGSGFESSTYGDGSSCTLTLDNLGRFIINDGDFVVWMSNYSKPYNTKPGNYAAILGPDQQVAVYGPSVWSVGFPSSSSSLSSPSDAELNNIPMVRNVLFSSQTLYNNSNIATRDYTFVMQDDCNLALIKGTTTQWQSGTAGKGKNCFVRLDHRGQLAVENDQSKVVWASKPVGKVMGDYVLVMQINGEAVIYGPVVWSTASS